MQNPFKVNGKPFFILGGQVHNSSGYSRESMATAWLALRALQANTAEVPVYWEQVEPVEGQFVFDHLDAIIQDAQANNIKLVLLWFATWKNGSMQYAPGWVKSNPERFWPVQTTSGSRVWVLSSHCQATWEADRNAFRMLLGHLREADPHQTVIGIQIENEPGILCSVRDYSPTAEAEYTTPLPHELMEALKHAQAGQTAHSWERMGCPETGSWEQVFGRNAPEYFTAWSIARYIDKLAEAGKDVYPLPMYVNVWLGENGWRLPGGNYPSGGPVTAVLDLWKWATPHIDLIAPDIYVQPEDDYNTICRGYARADNPLFIPESGGSLSNALNLFEAIARYHAIGYAVFGIESLLEEDGSIRPEARPLVESFACVSAIKPLIETYHGTDKIHAVVQREFQGEQWFDFGDYLGLVRFSNLSQGGIFSDFRHRHADREQRGRGLIITPEPGEFYLVGAGYQLMLKKKLSDRQEFSRANDHFDGPLTQYLYVEEGHFDLGDGQWVSDRFRNGDEITSGLWVAPDVGVVHAVLVDQA